MDLRLREPEECRKAKRPQKISAVFQVTKGFKKGNLILVALVHKSFKNCKNVQSNSVCAIV